MVSDDVFYGKFRDWIIRSDADADELKEAAHKTTVWADKTTTYTQHPQPLCNTTGKLLSGPRVNKGFPYMEDHTEPLCGQRVPPRTPNTHMHCVPHALCDTNGKQLSRPRIYKGFP